MLYDTNHTLIRLQKSNWVASGKEGARYLTAVPTLYPVEIGGSLVRRRKWRSSHSKDAPSVTNASNNDGSCLAPKLCPFTSR